MNIIDNVELKKRLDEAVWAAKSLFDRGKASGTSANISFRYQDYIYISGSGTCFGTLSPAEFAAIKYEDAEKYIYCMESFPVKSGLRPSKELPLHYFLYRKSPDIKAVIHTHSFYSTLISCLDNHNEHDIVPSYTPYLKMKVGSIGLVPFARPGSKELFQYMEERVNLSDGFILKNHGPLIAGKSMMDAFAGLEELEESAKIAWYLRNETVSQIDEKSK